MTSFTIAIGSHSVNRIGDIEGELVPQNMISKEKSCHDSEEKLARPTIVVLPQIPALVEGKVR